MTTPDLVEREVFVPAPVDTVWQVLTRAEHIRSWYAFDGAEFDARPGGAVVFRWKEHGTYRGVVEVCEPPRTLAFRASTIPDAPPATATSTLVTFALTPGEDGTTVRVVESGIAGLAGSPEERAEHAELAGMAWEGGLEALAALAVKS
jgi:uncharacterized protein YndB with AHSA1/START domain